MPHIPRNIQSPYTATDFWNRWSSVNPRMALFIKVSPKALASGTPNPLSAIGFTSNTRDMELPGHSGIVFKSAVGITPSAIEQKLDESANLEMQGMYTDGTFERNDVLGGLWDFADVEVFSCPWDIPALGELVHFKGNLAEFKDYEISFNAEARGLISRLSSDAGVVTTRYCRVKDFGDSQCKFTSNTVTIDGTTYSMAAFIGATAFVSNKRFISVNAIDFLVTPSGNPIPPSDFFNNGTIECQSGNNVGISREVLKYTYADGVVDITVKRAFPFTFDNLSEQFYLKAGCNRTLEDCRKYNNVINFRGEPYIPGIEAMNRIPPSN